MSWAVQLSRLYDVIACCSSPLTDLLQLEGFRSSGAEEKKDEVTHIGMFRRKLAQSFGHLHSQSGRGGAEAAADRASREANACASSQGLAEGPVTDNNLATGPNVGATAAKLKVGLLGSLATLRMTTGIQKNIHDKLILEHMVLLRMSADAQRPARQSRVIMRTAFLSALAQ